VNGIIFGPGVAFGPGVSFGGADIFKFQGTISPLLKENGVLIVKGFYQRVAV